VRVIEQARRRVLNGEQVPAGEKIYSIFERRTDLIKAEKYAHRSVALGYKVFLAESATGLITRYEVLKGNPVDEVQVIPSCSVSAASFAGARKPTALIDLAGHTAGAEYADATVANSGASKVFRGGGP
jgi:transposase, IS5 family